MDIFGGIIVALGFAVLLFGGIDGVVNLQMLSIGLALVTAGSAMFCAGAIYSLKDKLTSSRLGEHSRPTPPSASETSGKDGEGKISLPENAKPLKDVKGGYLASADDEINYYLVTHSGEVIDTGRAFPGRQKLEKLSKKEFG